MESHSSDTLICNLKQAQSLLPKVCLEEIEHLFDDLLQNQNLWTDFLNLQNDIESILELLNSNFELGLHGAINCVFFNRLHDFLMPLVYEQFEEEDKYFYSKSLDLCNSNVTAEQVGACVEFAIPLLAGIVELSSLDSYKSPLEKLQCLCTTYDLIFAELKSALIEVIANQPGCSTVIPVINNSDIIPILINAIIQSKLFHLSSNFFYIQTFMESFEQDSNFRHVLRSYEEAIQGLRLISCESLKPSCEKVCKDLDLFKIINMTSEIESIEMDESKPISLLDKQILRVTGLIIRSTNENYSDV